MSLETGLVRLLRLWIGVSAVTLMATTYPLWFPTTTRLPFPQVPMLELFCSWPIYWDWLTSAILILAWLLFATNFKPQLALAVLLVCGVLLVTLNQHRFQPWHYQLLLSALLLQTSFRGDSKPIFSRFPLQCFLISIYIFSALSKFDFEFLHTVGANMFGQVTSSLGLAVRPSPWVVASVPGLELIVGLGLCWARTRKMAGVAACLLHLGLILLLSPLGLNHSWGVLVWNLHFLGLSYLLFVRPPAETKPNADAAAPTQSTGNRPTPSFLPAYLLLVPIMGLPLVERLGLWDHWPSWALYAPHSSRVQVYVATNYLDRLPDQAAAVASNSDDSIAAAVPLDQWSLNATFAPIYPQSRFQLGVARYLSQEVESEFAIQAELLSSASRMDGHRDSLKLNFRRELETCGERFWLNTKPRD